MRTLFYCVSMCVALGMLHAAPPRSMNAPQPCCAPDQLEYRVGESIGFSPAQGQPGLTMVDGTIAVDYTKKKMAARTNGDTSGQHFNTTVIGDYDTGVMWTVDEIKQTCTKGKLAPGTMTGQCLPNDARYVRSVTFGLGTTVSGDSWSIAVRDEATQTSLDVFIIMSSDTCVPLVESVNGTMGELNLFVGMSYFDMKDSISDPSVFDVPKICQKDGVTLLEKMSSSPLNNFLVHKQHMK